MFREHAYSSPSVFKEHVYNSPSVFKEQATKRSMPSQSTTLPSIFENSPILNIVPIHLSMKYSPSPEAVEDLSRKGMPKRFLVFVGVSARTGDSGTLTSDSGSCCDSCDVD
jgi:hypothetical protein